MAATYFLLGLLCSIACVSVAAAKNRNRFVWFVLGLFFSLAGLIVLAILPKLPSRDERDARRFGASATLRECPSCLQLIPREAKVCSFCQRDVRPVRTPSLDG